MDEFHDQSCHRSLTYMYGFINLVRKWKWVYDWNPLPVSMHWTQITKQPLEHIQIMLFVALHIGTTVRYTTDVLFRAGRCLKRNGIYCWYSWFESTSGVNIQIGYGCFGMSNNLTLKCYVYSNVNMFIALLHKLFGEGCYWCFCLYPHIVLIDTWLYLCIFVI